MRWGSCGSREAIRSAGHWNDADTKLGTTGPKGAFFLRKGRQIHEFFRVKAREGARRPVAEIQVCGDLSSWGLPPSKCTEIIDAALALSNAD